MEEINYVDAAPALEGLTLGDPHMTGCINSSSWMSVLMFQNFLQWKVYFFARATITKHHKLVAQAVEIYALTLWKLEIQDRVVGMVGFFWGR